MKYLFIFLVLLTFGCVVASKPTARIEFDAPEAYPEGVVYDSLTNVFYVTSERLGTIGRVTRNGVYSVLLNDPSFKSSYGIKVHPDGKRLFVCVGDPNYSKFTTPETRKKMIRLIGLDKLSGQKTDDIDLSNLTPGKHFLNDLTFDPQGNIYLTDSYANVIYKVEGNKASVFADDQMFKTEGNGLNGIVYHPGGYLLVDNTNTGCIYKVDIQNPKQVQKVKTEQFFLGADGLVLVGRDKLVMVVNGGSDKIYQLQTTDNWASAKLDATTLAGDRFTYPATATRMGNEIWVMNAKTSELADSNSVPSKRFAIQQAVLKPLPR